MPNATAFNLSRGYYASTSDDRYIYQNIKTAKQNQRKRVSVDKQEPLLVP